MAMDWNQIKQGMQQMPPIPTGRTPEQAPTWDPVKAQWTFQQTPAQPAAPTAAPGAPQPGSWPQPANPPGPAQGTPQNPMVGWAQMQQINNQPRPNAYQQQRQRMPRWFGKSQGRKTSPFNWRGWLQGNQ